VTDRFRYYAHCTDLSASIRPLYVQHNARGCDWRTDGDSDDDHVDDEKKMSTK